MAFQMLAYLVVGAFLGGFIDKRIGTDKPYFTVLFLLLFTGAYFYRLFKDLESNKQ